MDRTAAVSINIVTEEQYITTVGGGGLKISIDGDRLNRYANENRYNWSDWHPEYVGDDVSADIWELISTANEMVDEFEIYKEYDVDIMESLSTIVLEPIDEQTVRIAFRAHRQNPDADDLFAAPASACGYPVDLNSWVEEVLRAGDSFRKKLVDLGYEDPEEEGGYGSLLDELECKILDTRG